MRIGLGLGIGFVRRSGGQAAPPSLALSMASARIGQPITLTTDATNHALYLVTQHPADTDETTATSPYGNYRLHSGDRAETGLIVNESGFGRRLAVCAVNFLTGARTVSALTGVIGYPTALVPNGTTIRFVADEAALAALSSSPGFSSAGGIEVLLLAGGRTWDATALNGVIAGRDRSALKLIVGAADPANLPEVTAGLSLNGSNNIEVWGIVSRLQSGGSAFYHGNATNCWWYGCVHIGPKPVDSILTGADTVTRYTSGFTYVHGVYAEGSSGGGFVGGLLKWEWAFAELGTDASNMVRGFAFKHNTCRGAWADAIRVSGGSLTRDTSLSARGVIENNNLELAFGYYEETLAQDGSELNDALNPNGRAPHPDYLTQFFGNAVGRYRVVRNRTVPGPYRASINNPNWGGRTPTVQGLLNNTSIYRPEVWGNIIYSIGANTLSINGGTDQGVGYNSVLLQTFYTGASGSIRHAEGTVTGYEIDMRNVVWGSIDSSGSPQLPIENSTLVNAETGFLRGFAAGGPRDAIDAIWAAIPLTPTGQARGAVDANGYQRPVATPAAPTLASITAVEGGFTATASATLNGGTLVGYFVRVAKTSDGVWTVGSAMWQFPNGSISVGSTLAPLANEQYQIEVFCVTDRGVSDVSSVYTVTPLAVSPAAAPSVTHIRTFAASAASVSSNRRFVSGYTDDSGSRTLTHVALGFFSQFSGSTRGWNTNPLMYYQRTSAADGTAFTIEAHETNTPGGLRKSALVGQAVYGAGPTYPPDGFVFATTGSGNFAAYSGGALFRIDEPHGDLTPAGQVGTSGGTFLNTYQSRSVTVTCPPGSKLLALAYGNATAPNWTGVTQTGFMAHTTNSAVVYYSAMGDSTTGGSVTVTCDNCAGLIVMAVPKA